MSTLTVSTHFPPITHDIDEIHFFNQGPMVIEGFDTLIFTQLGSQLYTPRFRAQCQEWRQLISNAIYRGATVVVFLDQFIQDATMTETGTFNNEVIGHNFEFLPVQLEPLTPAEGRDIQLSNQPIFKPLWEVTQKYWKYSCLIEGKLALPLALSKSHKKPVSGIFKIGQGNLVLLPCLDWYHSDLLENESWTPKGKKLGGFIRVYFQKLHPHLKAFSQSLLAQ